MERPLHRNREYVELWVGQTVSALGISISSFAHPLVVLAATGSPAKAGLVGSVLAGTTFFLRLPAGALVDRWNRKAILVVCDVGRALSAGVSSRRRRCATRSHVTRAACSSRAWSARRSAACCSAWAARCPSSPTPSRTSSRSSASSSCGPRSWIRRRGGRSGASPGGAGRRALAVAPAVLPRRPRPDDPGGAAFSSIGLVILVLARERGATSAQLGAMFAITSGGGVLGALAAPWFLRHASARSARRRSSCHRRWAGSSSRRSRSSARTSCWDAPTARRSSSRASPRRSGR